MYLPACQGDAKMKPQRTDLGLTATAKAAGGRTPRNERLWFLHKPKKGGGGAGTDQNNPIHVSDTGNNKHIKTNTLKAFPISSNTY
jgi:hypothetical protein